MVSLCVILLHYMTEFQHIFDSVPSNGYIEAYHICYDYMISLILIYLGSDEP